MFDTPIDEMREQTSYSSKDIFWATQIINPEILAFGDTSRVLESIWHELDYRAAQNVFAMINDGELYCLRVKRFERNFDFVGILEGADFRETPYSAFPEISIGYRGSLSKVRVEPYFVATPPDWGRLPDPLTWVQIRHGISWRLRNDFKPRNLIKWTVKNILARVLCLPDRNPVHWGMGKF